MLCWGLPHREQIGYCQQKVMLSRKPRREVRASRTGLSDIYLPVQSAPKIRGVCPTTLTEGNAKLRCHDSVCNILIKGNYKEISHVAISENAPTCHTSNTKSNFQRVTRLKKCFQKYTYYRKSFFIPFYQSLFLYCRIGRPHATFQLPVRCIITT